MQVSATSNQIHETQNRNSPVASALPSENTKIRFLVTKILITKILGSGISLESSFASYDVAHKFYQFGTLNFSWLHLQVFQKGKLFQYELATRGSGITTEDALSIKTYSIITDRATNSQTIQSLAAKHPNLTALSIQKPTERALIQLSRLQELTNLEMDNSYVEVVNDVQKEFDPTYKYTFISDNSFAALLDCPKLHTLKLLNVRNVSTKSLEILQQKIPAISWSLVPTLPPPKISCYSNAVIALTAAKYKFQDGHYSMQNKQVATCDEAETFLKDLEHVAETSLELQLQTEAGSKKIALKPTVVKIVKPAEINTLSLDSEVGLTPDFETFMTLAQAVHNLILFNVSKQMLLALPKYPQIKTVEIDNLRFQEVQELHARSNSPKSSPYDPIDDKAIIVLNNKMPNLTKLTLKGFHNIPRPYIDFLNKTKPGFFAAEQEKSPVAIKVEEKRAEKESTKDKSGKDEK